MTPRIPPVPAGFHTVTPFLIVADGAAALEFYRQAFGAVELRRTTDGSGRMRHGEIRIGDSPIMVTEAYEYQGVVARTPASAGASTMQLYLYVDDADAWQRRAVAAGARELAPVTVQAYGDRTGHVMDPSGHIWYLATRVAELSPEELRRLADSSPAK